MSKGVNKVIILGNIGNIETKYMPNGNAVTTASIATSESWTDKQTNQKQERTEWHSVSFFNKLGEIAGQYLTKGSKVYVEGSIRTRKWQAQDGTDRYSTGIIASEMQMLDSKNSNPQAPQQQPQQQYHPQQPQQQQQQQQVNNQQPQQRAHQPSPHQNTPHSSEFNNGGYQQNTAPDFDDSIPF